MGTWGSQLFHLNPLFVFYIVLILMVSARQDTLSSTKKMVRYKEKAKRKLYVEEKVPPTMMNKYGVRI